MLGTVETILAIIVSLMTILLALWGLIDKFWGFSELLKRFGSLRSRELWIIATANLDTLRNDLAEARIIRRENIRPIDMGRLVDVSEKRLILLDYASVNEAQFRLILSGKSAKSGLLIYAPPPLKLPDDLLGEIRDNHLYTLLVNFCGRLVNDVLTAMMTTPR